MKQKYFKIMRSTCADRSSFSLTLSLAFTENRIMFPDRLNNGAGNTFDQASNFLS